MTWVMMASALAMISCSPEDEPNAKSSAAPDIEREPGKEYKYRV